MHNFARTAEVPFSSIKDWPTWGKVHYFLNLFFHGFEHIVLCQRGGVSDEPPWLRAATRHRPGTLRDVADVTDITDVADVMDITDVAGVTDVTGGTVRHHAVR